MSDNPFLTNALNRRQWLLLTGATLTGCGGGADSLLANMPGTGGTGIYQGSISGFGSVIVNGVTYDNSQAIMRLNDTVVSQDALRLGMVATVRAARVAGATLGTASDIEVWSVAQGLVSDVGADQFKVAGMTILTDARTWFYGFTTDAPLSIGRYVSVWGLQADTDGHSWSATCVVASTATADAVSSGMVKVENGQRMLNGLLLTGDAANSLADGVLTRVQGAWASASLLNVVSTKSIDSAMGTLPQDEVEIEGFVTTVPSTSGFMLGSITVEASPQMYSPLGAPIAVGSHVEVYGSWQGGVLKATKVELENESTPGSVEIKAPFQQFTSLADFVLQGQRCDATDVVLTATTQAALSIAGAIFRVKGFKNGDWLKVTEMELDH